MNFTISHINPVSEDALVLTNELFIELELLYGEGKIETFTGENEAFIDFIIVRDETGKPAASGALKIFDEQTAEIKRMYVKKEFRGKGISKLILEELEKSALNKNFSRMVLETGLRQMPAMKLYEQFKYKRMPCYGRYTEDPESVCYEKNLS